MPPSIINTTLITQLNLKPVLRWPIYKQLARDPIEQFQIFSALNFPVFGHHFVFVPRYQWHIFTLVYVVYV